MKRMLMLLLLVFPAAISAQRSPSDTVGVRSAPTAPMASFAPAAFAPALLRKEAPSPQWQPRPGTNMQLRLACIAVFVVGIIWAVKLALG
jgi:hypothetical protein